MASPGKASQTEAFGQSRAVPREGNRAASNIERCACTRRFAADGFDVRVDVRIPRGGRGPFERSLVDEKRATHFPRSSSCFAFLKIQPLASRVSRSLVCKFGIYLATAFPVEATLISQRQALRVSTIRFSVLGAELCTQSCERTRTN